jgi:DNA-binding NarL/FixJ family response regulator
MPIRVLLVDDHDLIRQGLRKVLDAEPDMTVVGEASTCAAATQAVVATEPTVTILDVNLPDGSGIDLVPGLKELSPQMGIVVLTMYDDDQHLFRCLEVGASAFIAKSAPSQGLVSAVRHAATSPHSFSAVELASAVQRRLSADQSSALTAREIEIVGLLALGLPVHSIATQLYISSSTTKTHLSRVYEKLGVANRTQAVMEALRLGLIRQDDGPGSLRTSHS